MLFFNCYFVVAEFNECEMNVINLEKYFGILLHKTISGKILEVAVGTLGMKGSIDMIHFQFSLDATERQWHSAGLSMFRGLLAKVGVPAR